MKVIELLDREERWSKNCLARDRYGNRTAFYSKGAHQWSLVGAIRKCYDGTAHEIIEKVMGKVGNIPSWEDKPERRFEEIISLVKELDI